MNQSEHNSDKSPSQPGPAPRAVEVACMLGDSIVHVDHIQASAGETSRRTSLLFILSGALFLLLSGVAFAKGVANAATNKSALAEWTEVYELSESQFRAEPLPLAYDYLAFGGLGLGLAGIAFGLFLLRAHRTKSEFTIGTSAAADFAADPFGCAPEMASAQAPTSIARVGDGGAVVSVAPGMSAELLLGPVAVGLSQLAADGRARPSASVPGGYEIDLVAGASVRLSTGQTSFFLRPGTATRSRVGALAAGVDRRSASFVLGSALVHAAVLLMLNWAPIGTKTLSVDAGSSSSRMTALQSLSAEDAIELESDDSDSELTGNEATESGNQTAAAGDHGLEGNDSAAESGRTQIAKRAPQKQMSRAQAVEHARSQGIAGAMKADYFRHLVGASDYSSGEADIDTWGHNGRDGSSAGDFGWSRTRGPGPGAGGNNDTISTDESEFYKPGQTDDGGKIGPKGRESKGPRVKFADAVVHGDGLDKSTIRRYIKRKTAQLRYAYEKALITNAGLRGTVTVTFVINAQGLVIQAKARGIGDASMLAQVERIFESIQFPRSKSGGILRVVYPINFHSAG